jgi:hypothetical protein
MGIVTMGVPQEITVELARLRGATVFVETGTFHGGTTRWASRHFDIVHTIERAEKLYHMHSNELSRIKGVTPHFGDSRNILPKIVRDIPDQRAVFWLDGHWSGGETAGEDDECPLLEELACLSSRTEDIFLIDDARLFLGAPPLPYNPSQWPTISNIINVLPTSAKKQFVQIVDDVIFIVPSEDALRNCLVEYAQNRANDFWNLHRNTPSLKSRLKTLSSRIRSRLKTG